MMVKLCRRMPLAGMMLLLLSAPACVWADAVDMQLPVFPRAAQPLASSLHRLDVSEFSRQEQFSLVVLQGLINRQQPRLWLHWGNTDAFWEMAYDQVGYDLDMQDIAKPQLAAMLRTQFRSIARGLLVYDEQWWQQPQRSPKLHVISAIAAQENLIPVTSDEVEDWPLPVRFDARQRWADPDEAYVWLLRHYPQLAQPAPLVHWHPRHLHTRDYQIAHRLLPLFYWQGMASETVDLFNDILKQTGPNQPIIGLWHVDWYSRHVGGPDGIHDEHRFLTHLSAYGKYLMVIGEAGIPNMTIHAAMDYRPPADADAPANREIADISLEQDKVYLALVMSDGDNLGWANQSGGLTGSRWWSHEQRGSVPITWTISPAKRELLPGMLSYYQQTATANDHFAASVCGIGYMLVNHYASHYPDTKHALADNYWRATGVMMRESNLRSMHLIMDYNHNVQGPARGEELARLRRIALAMDGRLDALVLDYHRRDQISHNDAAFMVEQLPVFHAMTIGSMQPHAMAADIRRQTRQNRPAFMHVFIENWRHTPGSLKSLVQELGPDYTFVDVGTLARLYQQWQQQHNAE